MGEIDGGSCLKVGEGSGGGVAFVHAAWNEIAGIGDTGFDVRSDEAEVFFEMIVEVVAEVTGADAVGGVAGGSPRAKVAL